MAQVLSALVLALWTLIVSAQHDQKTLPKSVLKVIASREMRHHHFLWHNIRENWNRLSAEAQKEITDLGWAPPNPSRRYDENGTAIAIMDNYAGEDFLYMHRQMIAKVNKILSDNNEAYGKVKGWAKLPGPNDKEWPILGNYTIPNSPAKTATVNKWKTSTFYHETIVPTEKNLTDPEQLKKMTLSQLGTKIELTLHGWYHLRFSGPSAVDYRPTLVAGLPEIDKKWDDPKYDWLVDSYGSHVHPIFYKIHGWIDDRVEDWRKANGLNSIKWKGTWEGGPMSNMKHLWGKKVKGGSLRGSAAMMESESSGSMDHDVMRKVTDILMKEGKEVSFADPVVLDAAPISISATPLKPKKEAKKGKKEK